MISSEGFGAITEKLVTAATELCHGLCIIRQALIMCRILTF